MEAACLRQTDLPNTSHLFADFTYHFDRVAPFYHYPPHDLSAVRDAASAIHYPDQRREALIAALRAQNGDTPSLERLARPGAVAVVTGQQVGLFSGPAYTMYKALTAAKTAAYLTKQGIEAVPVFWLATEDHDLAEIDHSWNFGPGHQPVVFRAGARAEGQQPVGQLRMEEVPALELKALLSGFTYGEEVSALVAEAYRPGTTFGVAFQRIMRALLGRYDLLYLDPLEPAIREIAAPFLREAVTRAPELKTALLERNAELAGAGYHAQVHVEPKTSLFFLLEGGERLTLRNQNGSYAARDSRFSAEDLAARAEHLSPNALLRPVMQDFLLPTVMYIGGPAELAYMAQAEVLYRRLLGRMPVIAHRSGFTLLDSRARKLMDRYRLQLEDVFEGGGALRESISRCLVPPDIQRTFDDTQRTVEAALFRLGESLTHFDPTLSAALEKSRAKMLYQLAKNRRKVEREALRRESRSEADAQYLSGLLFPNEHLQERLYSILPFLAKHGVNLLDDIYEHVCLECPDHQVLVV